MANLILLLLKQTAVQIIDNDIVATFAIELPARGRTIMGVQARELLIPRLKKVIQLSLFTGSYNMGDFEQFVTQIEDQEYLRKTIMEAGGITFIPNGAILCRASGNSDKPMAKEKAIPYESPKSLEVSFMLKSKKVIKGTLIKRGVTIIIGGGFHVGRIPRRVLLSSQIVPETNNSVIGKIYSHESFSPGDIQPHTQ